jgi:hypothetical protein
MSLTVDEHGRFALAQETNAYAIAPSAQWNGHTDSSPPLPEWGTHPCGMRDPLTEALAERRHSASAQAMLRASARLTPTVGRMGPC